MEKFKKSIKKSYFYVNKLYIFITFVLLVSIDFSLGFYYFLLSVFMFCLRILNAHIPIMPKKPIYYVTYTYKQTGRRHLKMDIWYPQNFGETKYPLVFFCHGGGWISGFRNQKNNVSWCKYLASNGLCVSSIDYRYGLKSSMNDILFDYTDALDFIKYNSEKLKVDKEKIVLMGLSAGGHLSLLYSAYNSYRKDKEKMEGIKGVVAYYSPSDLKDIFTPENKSLFARFSTKKTLKVDPKSKNEILDSYSPINWVSSNMIPCFLAHGKEDDTVPYSSSQKFYDKLKENGINCYFLTHDKGGHSFDSTFKDDQTVYILNETLNFIKSLFL
ncbi:alpha/beta hydrolase [Acidilutibacter cellobiosedens]|uniref:Alpha/beta hydrolase n=2 Tax=Tissierellia TaxID=1737404 RepID=A0A410QDV9_9FIRM|nr:alpha/beta hydrolase [Tissierellaceae bacterium]QAT62028.1 alpha/beta hydrolase [Acidilutibacter cellobiosedens]SCL85303.1 acetyl esterase [Sporanaerobacter sp. PP17-6a]